MIHKKTLVFGASLNPDRYSNIALNRLSSKVIEVKAFGPKKATVYGLDIDTDLKPYKGFQNSPSTSPHRGAPLTFPSRLRGICYPAFIPNWSHSWHRCVFELSMLVINIIMISKLLN